MKQEDREKTTFCASRGLFHYRVMSFGLVNAGARYSHMMGMVLNGLDHFGNYQRQRRGSPNNGVDAAFGDHSRIVSCR